MLKLVAIILSVSVNIIFSSSCMGATPKADRIAVESRVKKEIEADFAQPYALTLRLAERKCLDGRSVKDFQGEVIEYWANLECPYCGIAEPLKPKGIMGIFALLCAMLPLHNMAKP